MEKNIFLTKLQAIKQKDRGDRVKIRYERLPNQKLRLGRKSENFKGTIINFTMIN